MNNKWLIPMEQPKYVSRHDKTKIHKCPPPILFATEYYILDVFACLNVYVESTVKAN